MWVYLAIALCSAPIIYSKLPDVGDILLFMIRRYEDLNIIIRPIKGLLEDKRDITEIYINNILSSLDDVKECKEDDLIEILWRNRYRAIYRGNNLDLVCPFGVCSDTTNILLANLHKSTGEVIDITERINQYSGPDGNFFKDNSNIENISKNFYNSRRELLLTTDEDYIMLLDKKGDEIRLQL